MTNLEKYEAAFLEALCVPGEQLAGLKRQSAFEWDSVGHMQLVTTLEEAFHIVFDTDDIFLFDSYQQGKEILKRYGIEI